MIRVLGSGSTGNAILIEGDPLLLLDAGINYRELQRLTGHRTSKIAAAFLTHEHQDHAKSIPNLLKAGVPCYATPGTWKALGIDHHNANYMSPGVGGWFQQPAIGVHAIATEHDAAEPCAWLITAEDYSSEVLYITDTAKFEFPWEGFHPQPTHILIEANHRRAELEVMAEFDQHSARVLANHMSVEGAIETLARLDLSECQEVHLLHMSARNADEQAFVDEVQTVVPPHTRVFAAPERGEVVRVEPSEELDPVEAMEAALERSGIPT